MTRIVDYSKFRRNSSLFTSSLLASFIGLWFVFSWFQNHLNENIKLNEGLETCFRRASQTYSARMIGGVSNYVSSSFTGVTEECFTDLSELINHSVLLKNNKNFISNLKELVNGVYWFHRKKGFDEPFTNNEGDEFEELTATFEEMESLKENLGMILSLERTTLEKRQKVVYYGEIVLAIAFFISIFFLIYRERLFSRKMGKLEEFAAERDEKEFEPNELENIITTSISATGMDQVADAFQDYKNLALKNNKEFNESLESNIFDFSKIFNNVVRNFSSHILLSATPINFSLDNDLTLDYEIDHAQEKIEAFMYEVLSLSSGGILPVEIRVKKIIDDSDLEQIILKAVSKNICLVGGGSEITKEGIVIRNITRNDGAASGIEFSFNLNQQKTKLTKKLTSLFKGTKKEFKDQVRS